MWHWKLNKLSLQQYQSKSNKSRPVSFALCFVQGKQTLEEELKELKSVGDSLQKELATCKIHNHH